MHSTMKQISMKWPCSANDVTALIRKGFQVLVCKFGGVMLSTVKQIVNQNGHAQLIFGYSTELWYFHARPGPGLQDDSTTLTH